MDSTTIIRIVAGILFFVLALLYFQPSYIGRKKRNARAIFLVNLLTGWCVISWVIVLIWAYTDDPVQVAESQPQVAAQPPAHGNARARRFGFLALIVAASVLAIILYVRLHNGSISSNTSTSPITGGPSDVVGTYHDSDEILDPYDLSKNPYKWKDHSGILDTVEVPVVMSNGKRVGQVAYPGGCLKFEKMLDEHTATYSVLVGEGSVVPNGEIAVILPNSDPPDSARPWRVFVEGPMQAVNGFGATITVATVRFEGYYVPQPKPAGVAAASAVTKPENPGTRWTEEPIKWTAMSHTASSITGDVETSPSGISISGGDYPLIYVRDLHGDELSDSAEAVSAPRQASPSMEGLLFATHIPASVPLVNGNTICGTDSAVWILVISSHIGGSDPTPGDWLYLAFFSGDAEPVLQAQALKNSRDLCGTFNYQEAAPSRTSSAPR